MTTILQTPAAVKSVSSEHRQVRIYNDVLRGYPLDVRLAAGSGQGLTADQFVRVCVDGRSERARWLRSGQPFEAAYRAECVARFDLAAELLAAARRARIAAEVAADLADLDAALADDVPAITVPAAVRHDADDDRDRCEAAELAELRA